VQIITPNIGEANFSWRHLYPFRLEKGSGSPAL
jgi:hypothetical protein